MRNDTKNELMKVQKKEKNSWVYCVQDVVMSGVEHGAIYVLPNTPSLGRVLTGWTSESPIAALPVLLISSTVFHDNHPK